MQEELNKFLRSQRVLQVEHRLVQDGGASYWSFCIKYLDGKSGALKGRSNRIDYKEVLDEATFAKFSALRSIRKAAAEAEGVPVYNIFTNEQLAALAQEEEITPESMIKINGIGEKTIAKFAHYFTAGNNEKSK